MTRAWTYQEAALSRRCLIFAPSQVHFVCRSYTVCEPLPLPFIGGAGSHLDWHSCTRNPEALPWSQSIDTAASYRMKIQRLNLSISEYQSRNMTCDTDALNAFRGILARTGLLTLYGLPIHHSLHGSSRRDYDDWVGTLPKSNFLRSLSWTRKASTKAPWAGLARRGSKIVLDSKLSLRYQSESRTRRKGMPTWSWVSCKTQEIDMLAAFMDYGEYSKVNHSSEVSMRHGDESVQIAPLFMPCDGYTESKTIPILTFPNAYFIKGIAVKPSINRRGFRSSDSVCSLFEILDTISVVKKMQAEQLRDSCGVLWMHVDAEAEKDLAAIAAGQAVLDAVLLEIRSEEGRVPQSLYHFLLVCRRDSQPVTRVGVLKLILDDDSAFVNLEVLSRGCVELV